jgi:hypothetical protein
MSMHAADKRGVKDTRAAGSFQTPCSVRGLSVIVTLAACRCDAMPIASCQAADDRCLATP